MGLKEQIENDIADVFLNEMDFAEKHKISFGGEQFEINVLIEKSNISSQAKKYGGFYKDSKTLYFAARDVSLRPLSDEIFLVDGQTYIVVSSDLANGMYTVVLEIPET